jgi:hypothetical protein
VAEISRSQRQSMLARISSRCRLGGRQRLERGMSVNCQRAGNIAGFQCAFNLAVCMS